MASSANAPGSEVVGQARAITKEQEPYGSSHRVVLRFRVERFDADGNLIAQVPVEMRGLSFHGSIAEGDEVRLTGRERNGTVRTRRVENVTTGALVTARDQPRIITAIAVVIALGVLVAAVAFIVAFIAAW